ncbi:MAG: hypothetical protein ABIQ16_10850 [Polyangiaceae bacterium]
MRIDASRGRQFGVALFALALGCGQTSNDSTLHGDGGSPEDERGGSAAGGSRPSAGGVVGADAGAADAGAGRHSIPAGGSSGVAGSEQLTEAGSSTGGDAGAASAAYKLCRGDRPVSSRDQYLALVAEECTEIMGALTISLDFDWSSLPPLTTLTLVGRQMTISHNPRLTSLSGFPELESVGEELTVEDNPALTALALPKLSSVGVLSIGGLPPDDLPNSALTSLSLPNFRTARRLIIAGSPLHDLSGLGGLETVTDIASLSGPIEALTGLGLASVGSLTIDLPLVKSLSGLEALRQVNQLSLLELAVSDLTGLHDLVARSVSIGACPKLTSLQGLGSGVLVQEWELYGNEHMTSLDGMPLAGLKGVYLQGLDQLSSLSVLSDVESLSALSLSTLKGLSNLHGLERLRDVSDLRLEALPQLSTLSGLSGLRNVYTLSLISLGKLEGLGGLSSLEHIYTDLILEENPLLSSLAPFLSWPPGAVRGSVAIRDNPLLPQCEVEQFTITQVTSNTCALCTGNLPGACP